MKRFLLISIGALLMLLASTQSALASKAEDDDVISFNFYGDSIHLNLQHFQFLDFQQKLSQQTIEGFYRKLQNTDYLSVLSEMLAYKNQKNPNDWVYYQLIRKVAQSISPKRENYERYTLYKWFFLAKSGYDTRLVIFDSTILFFVYSEDNIYDLPTFEQNGKNYVCLNYHDYGKIDFEAKMKEASSISIPEGAMAFSYKITQLPDFTPSYTKEKELSFEYENKQYHFQIDLNPEVDTIFKNYPVVDFASYFNIPLSKKTYQSLIPKLKDELKGKTELKGIDYLMEFTRNAFLYENDKDNFGKEKRLSPEQTLFNQYSDCDDRVALFFYLVKEIYNRPMIVLLYPTHVTIAVNFEKNIGKPIYYNNMAFTVCEPTPQNEILGVGELPYKLRKQTYTIAYAYNPE